MARSNPKNRERLKRIKAQAGIDRAEHFASGNDLASWRGVHTVIPDKKKEKSRKACRKKTEDFQE